MEQPCILHTGLVGLSGKEKPRIRPGLLWGVIRTLTQSKVVVKMDYEKELGEKFRFRWFKTPWWVYVFWDTGEDKMMTPGFYKDIFFDGVTYCGFNFLWLSIMVADFEFD